ncbi:MAG: hypothetical protein RLZ44_609 [Pseudomonadota bacterium]
MLFQGFQTPTEVRIRKTANGGYLVEYLLFDPQAAQPCHRHGVKGEVYGDLTELMHHVEQYLGHGKGCLCEDCDHDSRPD